MSELHNQERAPLVISPESRAAEASLKPVMKKAVPGRAESVSAIHSSRSRLRAPATPLMLTPTNAWRRLCARTGGSIDITTFYRWIRRGSVYTVRMGRNIFIPITALDELIKRCLSGEEL